MNNSKLLNKLSDEQMEILREEFNTIMSDSYYPLDRRDFVFIAKNKI